MKHETPIDWFAVEEAARRCKLNRAQPGDTDLCARAFEADPGKYREVSERGHAAAHRTVNPLAKGPEC